MLSHRVPRGTGPNTWSRLIDERRASGGDLIDLAEVNPTRVGLAPPGEWEGEALADARARVYEPDPRGARAAREAVASYYAGRGIALDPECLLLTTGTSESYAHLFRLLCDPGERILVPSPSYPLFEPIASLEGVRVGFYRLAYDGGWHLDRDALERAVDPSTRAVVVVQPNHPTGSCLSREDQEALEDLCLRRGLVMISDEVFGDYPWHATSPLPSLLEPGAANRFVLSGLSKVCGLPQMKLGWIALAGSVPFRDEALRGLEWIADLFLSVGTPVQLALPALLEARHAFQRRARERIAANLARLDRSLEAEPAFDRLAADGGWAVVLRLPRTRTEEEWTLELLRRDVIAHPGHFYDFEEEAHLVISLIAETERFAAGLARIEELVAEQ